MTPDSMSREGSPIPEASSEMEVGGQTVMAQTAVIPTLAELRYSQSAPGSPSGEFSCYRFVSSTLGRPHELVEFVILENQKVKNSYCWNDFLM